MISVLIIGVIVVLVIAGLILFQRYRYQTQLMENKRISQANRLKVGEKYWYNSTKGPIGAQHPSCWAVLLGEPYIFNDRIIAVEVLLLTPREKVNTRVPAESLTEMSQINS